MSPDTGQIPRRFGYRQDSADIGVQIAVATVAIYGEAKPLLSPLDSDDRGIRSRRYDSVASHEMVVLAIDPALRGYVGGIEQRL